MEHVISKKSVMDRSWWQWTAQLMTFNSDFLQLPCQASARGGGAPPGDPNKERLLYMLTCQELSWCCGYWSGTVPEIDWTRPQPPQLLMEKSSFRFLPNILGKVGGFMEKHHPHLVGDFWAIFGGLTGHIVTVKLNNGQIWEGNFHACSSEGWAGRIVGFHEKVSWIEFYL